MDVDREELDRLVREIEGLGLVKRRELCKRGYSPYRTDPVNEVLGLLRGLRQCPPNVVADRYEP